MRRLLSFCLCLAVAFCAAPAFAQSPPTFLGMWGTQGTGPGQFQQPRGIAVDPSGVVWVADNGRVQGFTPQGDFITQWPSAIGLVYGLAADGLGRVYVMGYLSFGTRVVLDTYTAGGVLEGRLTLEGPGCECSIHSGGPAVTPGGDLYRTLWGAYQPFGQPPNPVAGVCGEGFTCWGTPGTGAGQFYQPGSLAVDPAGYIYVTDPQLNRIQKHAMDGTFVTQWGSSGSGEGQFSYAYGIAVGPSGEVYVADLSQSRISQFTGDGAFVTRWGSSGSGPGQFNGAYGVAVSSSGDIYVADSQNHRVQRFGNPPVPTVRSSWGRVKSLYR